MRMKTELLAVLRGAAAIVCFLVLRALPEPPVDLEGYVRPQHTGVAHGVVSGALVVIGVLAAVALFDLVRAVRARPSPRVGRSSPYRDTPVSPRAAPSGIWIWLQASRLVSDGVLVGCAFLAYGRIERIEKAEPTKPLPALHPATPRIANRVIGRNEDTPYCGNIVERTAICTRRVRGSWGAASPYYCEMGQFVEGPACEDGYTCEVEEDGERQIAKLDARGMPCTRRVIPPTPETDSRL